MLLLKIEDCKMMNIFLDTCSLVKLYHKETGTEELEKMFSEIKITKIFLSEISKIEFTSTIWKKVRTKEILERNAQITLNFFEIDFDKYTFIPTKPAIIELARTLTSKYKVEGLRTLDSVQLSTCVSLIKQVDIFITADKLLKTLFQAENLPIEISKF